jgi:hypothetical protein
MPVSDEYLTVIHSDLEGTLKQDFFNLCSMIFLNFLSYMMTYYLVAYDIEI